MIKHLRKYLRCNMWWLPFRESHKEGFFNAMERRSLQPLIIDTPPISTPSGGLLEVCILTWRRDWLNALWALKTFFLTAEARFPLSIYDGGLLPWHVDEIKAHFPTATIWDKGSADKRVEAELRARHLTNCLSYRRVNTTARKLFDFFLMTRAETIISIDSDIVFFRYPVELVTAKRRTLIISIEMMDIGTACSSTNSNRLSAFDRRRSSIVDCLGWMFGR